MKKVVLATLFIGLCISSASFAEVTKKTVERDNNGKAKVIVYYSDGKQIAMEEINKHGNSMIFGNIPDGLVIEYYDYGNLRFEMNYKNQNCQ